MSTPTQPVPDVSHIDPPSRIFEIANHDRCIYIANMSIDEFKTIAASSRQRGPGSDAKSAYKRTMNWAIEHGDSKRVEKKPGDGYNISTVEKTYQFGVGKTFGRMASNSLQNIVREIRGFVCTAGESNSIILTTDVDMTNAHPTILLWVCKNNGIACDVLEDFVANRGKHMEELMKGAAISKDEAKGMFLEAVNSHCECVGRTTTDFFKAFETQCKAIQRTLMGLEEYRFIMRYAETSAGEKLEEKKAGYRRLRKSVNKLTANVQGCFTNLVLCTWENRFLGVVCETLTSLSMRVATNAFDGVMIQGDHYPEDFEGDSVRDQRICPALEKALLSKYKINMGFVLKRHCTSLKYDKESLKMPYTVVAERYYGKICRVGAEYFVTKHDGYMTIEKDRDIEQRLRKESALCILRPNDVDWHNRSFASTLMNDPSLRQYEDADFYPDVSELPLDENAAPLHLNLWKPNLCESFVPEDNDPNSDHVAAFNKLMMALADNDEAVFTTMKLFIAQAIRYPHIKPNMWLVLMSEQGAGKSTLIRIMKLLFGDHEKMRELSNVRRSLLGSFNEAMLDAFWLCLNEAKSKDMFEIEQELKHYITEDRVHVNIKNCKMRFVRSFARFILTCQPRVMPTERGDRRGLICRCSDELIHNHEFWRELNERMDDPQFTLDVHAHLYAMDPPKRFNQSMIPTTRVQKDMQEANSDVMGLWLEDLTQRWFSELSVTREYHPFQNEGVYTLSSYCGSTGYENVTPEFQTENLFRDYRGFCLRTNMAHVVERGTYATFVANFSICRWRECFMKRNEKGEYPAHKVGGIRKQFREFDFLKLATMLNVPVTDYLAHTLSKKVLRGVLRRSLRMLYDEARSQTKLSKEEDESMSIRVTGESSPSRVRVTRSKISTTVPATAEEVATWQKNKDSSIWWDVDSSCFIRMRERAAEDTSRKIQNCEAEKTKTDDTMTRGGGREVVPIPGFKITKRGQGM